MTVSQKSSTSRDELLRTCTSEITYDIIKLRVFTQSSLCRNTNSAAGAFVVTFPEAFLNTIATEAVKAFRAYVCIGKMLQADGTLEIFHYSIHQVHSLVQRFLVTLVVPCMVHRGRLLLHVLERSNHVNNFFHLW